MIGSSPDITRTSPAASEAGTLRRKGTLQRHYFLLITAAFLLFYLLIDSAIGPVGPRFLLLTGFNLVATIILVQRLSGEFWRNLWAWALLVALLDGYFLKMVLVSHQLEKARYFDRSLYELQFLTGDAVLRDYGWITMGYVSYCLAAALVLSFPPRRSVKLDATSLVRSRAMHLLLVTVVAYTCASAIQVYYNVGVLGVGSDSGGAVGTLVIFARTYLTVALMLFAVWVLDTTRSKKVWVAVSLMMVVAVAHALISTSRGAFVLFGLPIVLLFLLTERWTTARKLASLGIVVLSAVMVSVTSAQRYERVSGESGTSSAYSIPSISNIVNGTLFALVRVQGVEGVWHVAEFRETGSAPAGLWFLRPRGLGEFYTRDVVEVSAENNARAPGLIGAQMLVGGARGVIIGMSTLTLLIGLAWRWLLRRRAYPVALALAATYVVALTEGTLIIGDALKVLLSILAVEVCGRLVLRPRKSNELQMGGGGDTVSPGSQPPVNAPA